MKRDFIIISIVLLFLANVSVMYYRNYEGFADALTKEEKEAKKLDRAIENDEKKLDTLDDNASVQKYTKLNKEIIKKKCKSAELKGDDVPEICDSTGDLSPSLGSFSGKL